jgi:Spy/CpxP family protein refolding chaperone
MARRDRTTGHRCGTGEKENAGKKPAVDIVKEIQRHYVTPDLWYYSNFKNPKLKEMKMPKYNWLLLVALLISATAFAQRPRGEMRPDRRPGWAQMQEELQLTEEQLTQIKAIEEKYREKAKALRSEAPGDPAERRSAIRELMEQQREEIHGVLTEQQRTLLEEKRKEREASREQRRSGMEELRQKLQSYRQENVLPVLVKQRSKLEDEISKADKALIDKLRAEHQAMREKIEEARSDPEKWKALRDSREAYRENMEQLRGLIEKYEADIERLFTEIMDERQQWREDMKELHDEYMREAPRRENRLRSPRNGRRNPEGMRAPRNGFRSPRGMQVPRGPRDGHFGMMMSKGQFLLLDPNAPAITPPARGQVTPSIETHIYPNPARQINTVSYTIKEAGEVRIELRDNDGRLVKVLLDEYRNPGEYKVDVDLSQLNDGVYYYTITDKTGKVTRKMIVSKE